MRRLARRSPLLLAVLLAFGAPAAERRAPRAKPAGERTALQSVPPAAVGLSAERLALLDGLVNDAIAKKELPGAVVLVGRHGKIAYEKAYGFRALEPEKEPMTIDTVFDLASLTKTVATATSVMTLVEAGKLRLTDAVVKHLPEFGAGGGLREKVTIEQLLTHRSGLPPDDPMDLYSGAPAAIFGKSFRLPLATAPGEKFVYSDVGYEVLAEVVRAVSGEPLDRYAKERVFAPLGMAETEFRPIGSGGALPVARIAPTEKRDGRFLRGEVHDPHAYALGGVAGHAGLFSTARDLARFCRMILDGGPVLSPAARAAMTRPRAYGDPDLRGLGWDIATAYSSSRGDLFPLGSVGHTGWTGTSFWLDPTTDTFVILLSNRNHPDGSGNVIALRSRVATIAASAVTDVDAEKLRAASLPVETLLAASRRVEREATLAPRPAARAAVLPGVEVLEAERFAAIAGKRVALLTNQTGVTRDGRSTIDVLASEPARAAGVKLVRLFSPEHGIHGTADARVPDAQDEKTALPIRSLYGERNRPSPEDLAGLDAVVVDLQDAGVRFYTYLTTLGYLLEEAGKARVAVVVLDRPDPIRASRAAGPLADELALSFTAYHTIPVVTGMTIGEVATLFDGERKLGASLTVVKMAGYKRALWYDETGLPWVNPSPNLRSLTEAALYPGVALLETTNVSVGRGTDTPFEVVGAPWIDAPRLASTLTARAIPGVRFTPTRFTPASSTHAGAACAGVRIELASRDALDPVRLGLELATALRDLHPREWTKESFGTLLASRTSLARFLRGESAAEIASGWAAELMEFESRRARYLLY